MCFCDGKYFLITNKTTGSEHFVRGDGVLHSFFEGFYSVPHLFHRMIKSEQIRWKDNYYTITLNSHPECVQVKQTIVKNMGIQDYKTVVFGESVQKSTDTCFRKKDNRKHCLKTYIFTLKPIG